MLAVQRPSMGSSKPPDLEMPFGYSFDIATSNFPFPSPTAPAPGPSLLDDNESKFLDSFFDGVSSDQFNYDFFNNPPDGSELGLGWDELPPTFMGTTSSFGQQPLSDPTFGGTNPPVNPGSSIPPSTSVDVLAAAAVLQNGSGRSQSINRSLFRGQDNTRPPTNGQARSQSLSQNPSRLRGTFQERPASDDYVGENYYGDLVFGSSDQMRHRGVSQKVDIRWGSDSGFGVAQGFVPPESQDTVAAVERSHMQVIENVFSLAAGTIQSSPETTRPSSPVDTRINTSHQRTKSIGQNNEEEDASSRARKRRKSKYKEEVEEEEESPLSPTFKSGVNKRKSVRKSNDSLAPESDSGHKRRKSAAAAAAAAKASRENLTEEQKRENHIKSEQKRRTLIREGFDDLGELVPGLKGGGFSKSAVLVMSADWLEDLIQGNEILRSRLDQLEGRL